MAREGREKKGRPVVNRAIHCTCGQVFSRFSEAEKHIADIRAGIYGIGGTDSHTLVDETESGGLAVTDPAGPPGETPTIALARQRIASLVASLGDVRTEIVRAQLAMEKTSTAHEAARAEYEAARVRLVEIDAELEVEIRELVSHVESQATK